MKQFLLVQKHDNNTTSTVGVFDSEMKAECAKAFCATEDNRELEEFFINEVTMNKFTTEMAEIAMFAGDDNICHKVID